MHPEAAEPPGPMPQEPATPNGQHRKNPFIRRVNKTAQLPDKGIFHFQTKWLESDRPGEAAAEPQPDSSSGIIRPVQHDRTAHHRPSVAHKAFAPFRKMIRHSPAHFLQHRSILPISRHIM